MSALLQGNGSCIRVCIGNISVRELSKSLFKLIYSFKNDSAMYYVPKENHNSFWPVKDVNTSKMQPLQMGMGSTSDCNDRVW